VTRIARCLQGATEHSLVLLDELGAGTDPEEGGSLGFAVLEAFEERQTMAVVTTHLGQLKDFAYSHEGTENGSMSFDGETLSPLYRLEIGIPGTSHALDIAGRVGMPHELVKRARELLGRQDQGLEEVIGQVQKARSGPRSCAARRKPASGSSM
jgi:DNA mismatch repair protein MutS2